MKTALVLGAGGFIGGHLIQRLKNDGYRTAAADLNPPEFWASCADCFMLGDLGQQAFCREVFEGQYDEVYQLAANMGGAGYIFTGEHDADIMHNSAAINLNVLEALRGSGSRVFYSSSACIYPAHNQQEAGAPDCSEASAYPSAPDSEYGWEKLFSERAYLAFARNYRLEVRIARYHNIFGPLGAWIGGREKAPAAICRKIAEARDGDAIEVWGDGEQTRSFLYIDECVEGTLRLMRSNFAGPVNIGSAEMVTINNLVDLVASIAGKSIRKHHIPGPLGVRGRCSDNRLIAERLGWQPSEPLIRGLERTYAWVEQQVGTKAK